MFKAYSLGLESRDFELIRKMVQIVTKDHVTIKDLRYYDIKTEDTENSIIFLFGKKTMRLADKVKSKKAIYLPAIHTLHAATGSKEKRQEAFKQLILLKDMLITDSVEPTGKVTIEDPIPDITVSDLKALETTLAKKNVNKWLTTTRSGKTIQISISPEKSKADMNITFGELYTLKIAMDTLDIQEFTIVYCNKTDK